MDLRERLQALHRKHPNDPWERRHSYDLEKLWRKVPPLQPEVNVALLDRRRSSPINVLVAVLPPAVILEEFGKDVLAAARLNYIILDDVYKDLTKAVAATGYDVDVLERIRLGHWRITYEDCAQPILSGYEIFDRIHQIQHMDITEPLLQSLRPGMRFPSNSAFSLDLLMTRKPHMPWGYEDRWFPQTAEEMTPGSSIYNIYLDTPLAFAICCDGKPAAIAGYLVHADGTLVMRQLQGVNKHIVPADRNTMLGAQAVPNRALAAFNQPHALVRVAEHVAEMLGFPATGILSGTKNQYIKPHPEDNKIHLPLERALRIYDGTAVRLGYKRNDDGIWRKRIGI